MEDHSSFPRGCQFILESHFPLEYSEIAPYSFRQLFVSQFKNLRKQGSIALKAFLVCNRNRETKISKERSNTTKKGILKSHFQLAEHCKRFRMKKNLKCSALNWFAELDIWGLQFCSVRSSICSFQANSLKK